MIDWNLRAGDLLVVASLAGTCFYYSFVAGKFATRIENMTDDIKELKQGEERITDVLIAMSSQKERMDAQGQRLNVIDQRIEDLRNGRGYIANRVQRGIDREYP